jgi:hypothetical protein
MISALFFGFLHLFIPGGSLYNFERLHIFLFNLVAGGTILIHFSEGQRNLSYRGVAFYLLALSYAILAFNKIYIPAMLIAILLAVLVESVRMQLFAPFPIQFFDSKEPVSKKFHQAALLCLSLGLVISALVILNNEYLNMVSFSKLKLDTFFLGFSFPLSLITMTVIFSFMKGDFSRIIRQLKNVGFWNVNLGVIIFFGFILFEKLIPQLVVTTILFVTVILIWFLYQNLGVRIQQKYFLASGIFFLLYTSATGILYIALEFDPGYHQEKYKFLLRMHSFASLYGWNLSGLAVICRSREFPIRLNSIQIIALHWITAALLAPLGTYSRLSAMAAMVGYSIILYTILFSQGERVTESNL